MQQTQKYEIRSDSQTHGASSGRRRDYSALRQCCSPERRQKEVENTAVLFEKYVLNTLSIKLQLSAVLLLVFADENCPQ
jgi:hypothetical protein